LIPSLSYAEREPERLFARRFPRLPTFRVFRPHYLRVSIPWGASQVP
jgi:hypothetical protein